MPNKSKPEPNSTIKDLIIDTKKQLLEASQDAKLKNEPASLKLKQVTLEINVTIEKGQEIGAGVGGSFLQLIPITANAKVNKKNSEVHRVVVELDSIGSGSDGGLRLPEGFDPSQPDGGIGLEPPTEWESRIVDLLVVRLAQIGYVRPGDVFFQKPPVKASKAVEAVKVLFPAGQK